jgi:hypothetical protein
MKRGYFCQHFPPETTRKKSSGGWSGFQNTVAGARRLRRFSIAMQIRVEAG